MYQMASCTEICRKGEALPGGAAQSVSLVNNRHPSPPKASRGDEFSAVTASAAASRLAASASPRASTASAPLLQLLLLLLLLLPPVAAAARCWAHTLAMTEAVLARILAAAAGRSVAACARRVLTRFAEMLGCVITSLSLKPEPARSASHVYQS